MIKVWFISVFYFSQVFFFSTYWYSFIQFTSQLCRNSPFPLWWVSRPRLRTCFSAHTLLSGRAKLLLPTVLSTWLYLKLLRGQSHSYVPKGIEARTVANFHFPPWFFFWSLQSRRGFNKRTDMGQKKSKG